jgi:hypothetical protein
MADVGGANSWKFFINCTTNLDLLLGIIAQENSFFLQLSSPKNVAAR